MSEKKQEKFENAIDRESELVELMSGVLSRTNAEYRQGVYVGGTVPDFYIVSPSTGSTSIFEVKAWEASPENINRAQNLAQKYVTASGADHAFIILEGLSSTDFSKGIVAPADLGRVVESEEIKERRAPEGLPPIIGESPERKIFAAMPFQGHYDDTYFYAMQPAALHNNAQCIRVDYQRYSGDIVTKIKELINDSVALIADLSESRPNVFYEMGYAEGLNKPIVQICSTPIEEIPFDVRNNKTIPYNIGQVSKLEPDLITELASILT